MFLICTFFRGRTNNFGPLETVQQLRKKCSCDADPGTAYRCTIEDRSGDAPDDSILDIRPFKSDDNVAASVPALPPAVRAPVPPTFPAPVIKQEPSSVLADVTVHAPPADVASAPPADAKEESVEGGSGPEDLPEPSVRPPPSSGRGSSAEASAPLTPIPEEDLEMSLSASLGDGSFPSSSKPVGEEIDTGSVKTEDSVTEELHQLSAGDATASLLSLTAPIGGATSTPVCKNLSRFSPNPYSSTVHPLQEDSFSSYPLILTSNPTLQFSPPTTPNHSRFPRSWSFPFPDSYLMAPIASPPPYCLSQLSECQDEGGASDSKQEESDGAHCLPPPTPSFLLDRRGARFRDCEIRRPYTPYIKKFWNSPSEAGNSVIGEEAVISTSGSEVISCGTTATATTPLATTTTTSTSPLCSPGVSASMGGKVFGGSQRVARQSSDQALRGKGFRWMFRARRGESQEGITPRHAVPGGKNLRAKLDFSNDSLHLAGNPAPALSPGGDTVMSEDTLAAGAQGSDRLPVPRPPAASATPSPSTRILRRSLGSRSRRNPRLKDYGTSDRVTRSQSRLSQGGLRVSVPEGTPKLG